MHELALLYTRDCAPENGCAYIQYTATTRDCSTLLPVVVRCSVPCYDDSELILLQGCVFPMCCRQPLWGTLTAHMGKP